MIFRHAREKWLLLTIENQELISTEGEIGLGVVS